ncbi:MAG: apolipoprotein N-acyltransferase, partial [Acidimicrobiales bacterium]
ARHRGRALSFTGAATLAEAVRMSWPFGGLPVGGVFLGQAGGPLLGTARLGGPLLLTALVWGGGAGLGELAVGAARWRRGSRSWPAAAGPVGVAVVVALGIAGALAPDGGAPAGAIRVAVAQGGGTRGFTAIETGRSGDFAAELAASAHLVGATHQTLVVWPEDVVALTRPLAGSPEAAQISALARTLRTTLLAGVTVTEPDARFLNEIVAWGPSGRIVSVFEKAHRVPFGEYVPFRGLFSHLANLDAVPRDAVPGRASGSMATPAGQLGLLVSYEVFFADRGRSSVRAGARLLVVPTNTSSYSSEQMPSQEVAADRVQAVEEGRDLVQAAPTGYSTFVTNTGIVVLQSVLSRQIVLVDRVALRTGATIYERFGDAPSLWLSGAALLAALLASEGARRRHA